MKPILIWQYKQLMKELLLLQGHAADPTCPCQTDGEKCIRKHLLTIEALAQETATIEPDDSRTGELNDLAGQAQELIVLEEASLCGEEVEWPVELDVWCRDWRKKFEFLECELPIEARQPDVQMFRQPDSQTARQPREIVCGLNIEANQSLEHDLKALINDGEEESFEDKSIPDPYGSRCRDVKTGLWISSADCGLAPQTGIPNAKSEGESLPMLCNYNGESKSKDTITCSQVSETTCSMVKASDYDLLGWFDSPEPYYGFSLESEVENKLDSILTKLREGISTIQESDNYRDYLLMMSRFHRYSTGNVMLIRLQMDNATHVAGYNKWKELDHQVRKGEKGIGILAPCGGKTKKVKMVIEGEEELGEQLVEIMRARPTGFKVVYVFDVSQTDGPELPNIKPVELSEGFNEKLFEHTLAVVEMQELSISFDRKYKTSETVKGYYDGKMIWLNPDVPQAQQLKTLIHELGHHFSEHVFEMERHKAEVIAESVAFVVGAHYGFDTGQYSFPYIVGWSEDQKKLRDNLADISKISAQMIEMIGDLPISANLRRIICSQAMGCLV